MRHDADRRRPAGRRSCRADFPTNRGGLCPRAGRPPSCSTTRERLTHAAGPRDAGDRASSLPATLGRGARPGRRRRSAHRRPRYGRDAVGVLRRRRADQREGVRARQVRPGRAAAPRTIDYNGRFCMSSAAAAGNRAFGIDRGLPFPLADIAEADVDPAGRRQPGRHHAAGHAVLRRSGRATAARYIVVDPRRTATAARRRPAPAAAARHRPGAGQRAAAHRDRARGCVDEEYIADAHHRLRRGRGRGVAPYWPDRVERITGVPVGRPARRPSRAARRRAERAMILTARGAEQHSKGTDTVQAFINLALALGPAGPAVLRLRHASPARATARAAASTARRPTSCPATASSTTRPPARTSPRCGASTRTSCPARARRRSSCSTALGTDGGVAGAAGARLQRRGVRARRAAGSTDRLRGAGLPGRLPTSSCPRPPRSPTSCCRPPSGPRRTAR